MVKTLFRRLLIIPVLLIVVHFVGYAFAHITFQLQQMQTAYGSGKEGITPVWPEYTAYVRAALHGDLGSLPVGLNEPLADALWEASVSSLGLVLLAFSISLFAGLALGLAAVRVNPPRTMLWLTLGSTLGMAMPGFTIGTLLVSGMVWSAMNSKGDSILPVAGAGWDQHLVLPVLALLVRPTMQIARVTASLLASELGKRYVVAARSFGHTWRAIRWDKALRNVLSPIILTMAGSFRVLMAELVLVEWLFSWPGLGRLLVLTLVPPNLSNPGGLINTSVYFLNPPLVAGLLVIFSFLFLAADLLASVIARSIDPRLRTVEEELPHD